jgi:hypothetical protein
MLGYKCFLLTTLSSGLLYGLIACFEKAYCYTVKIGPHLLLNGAAFKIGYVVVASIVAGILILIILRKKTAENDHSRGPPRVVGERRFSGDRNGGWPRDIALGDLMVDLESGFHAL